MPPESARERSGTWRTGRQLQVCAVHTCRPGAEPRIASGVALAFAPVEFGSRVAADRSRDAPKQLSSRVARGRGIVSYRPPPGACRRVRPDRTVQGAPQHASQLVRRACTLDAVDRGNGERAPVGRRGCISGIEVAHVTEQTGERDKVLKPKRRNRPRWQVAVADRADRTETESRARSSPFARSITPSCTVLASSATSADFRAGVQADEDGPGKSPLNRVPFGP